MAKTSKRCRWAGVAAGILLNALRLVRELEIEAKSPEEICEALGVSRSSAFQWAARLREQMETQPGPGRPPKERPPTDAASSTATGALGLCKAVRDWLLEHPGTAVAGHKRNAYTDDFRTFVIDLLAGCDAGVRLTREQQADAVGVRPDTLLRWLSPALPTEVPVERPAPTPADVTPTPAAPSLPTEVPMECSTPASANAAATLAAPPVLGDAPAAQPPAPAQPSGPPAPLPPLRTMTRSDAVARILALRKAWKGTLQAFFRSVREQGIAYSDGAIRAVLKVEQKRPVRPRRPKNPDAEATRGDYLRPDPNTQWAGDGTSLGIRIGGKLYRRSVQAVLDVGSGAIVGMAVRRQEDSRGLINAYEEGKESTGTPPLAMLRDGRKCNTAAAIETALNDDGVISQMSTRRRPQSNAIPENEFRQLKDSVPLPELPDPAECTPDQLADDVLTIAMAYYKAGRIGRPRRRLALRTPEQAQAEHTSTPERTEEEKEAMRRVQRRLEAEADSEARRHREATLTLVRQAFDELKLPDPKGKKVPAIAKYGLEAATEAIAVLKARIQAGTPPEAHPERFLLNTTRRIAYHHQDTRLYEHLVDQRIRAGDLVVKPLQEELHCLRTEHSADDFLKAVLYRATASPTAPDRLFWRRVFMAEFESLPPEQRPDKARWAVARIAGRLKLPYLERQYFLSLIAASAVPLVA